MLVYNSTIVATASVVGCSFLAEALTGDMISLLGYITFFV